VAVLDGGRIVASGSVSELTRRYGTPGLRLVFNGDAPALEEIARNGSEAVLETDDPGQAAAAVLPALGPAASRLTSVEVTRAQPGDSLYGPHRKPTRPGRGGGSCRLAVPGHGTSVPRTVAALFATRVRDFLYAR
jgi:hypothetical protein